MIIHVIYFNFFPLQNIELELYDNPEQFTKQFIFLSLDCSCQKLFSLIHQTWFSILSVALNCKAVNHALFKKNKNIVTRFQTHCTPCIFVPTKSSLPRTNFLVQATYTQTWQTINNALKWI